MSRVVDWEALAGQLGAFENSEICSSDMAKQAIEILFWSDLIEPLEAKEFLKRAKNHHNPQVRQRAKFVRKYLKHRT